MALAAALLVKDDDTVHGQLRLEFQGVQGGETGESYNENKINTDKKRRKSRTVDTSDRAGQTSLAETLVVRDVGVDENLCGHGAVDDVGEEGAQRRRGVGEVLFGVEIKQ